MSPLFMCPMTEPTNNLHPFDDPALIQREAELQAALEAAYAGIAADLRARLAALQARGGSAFEQARLPELIHQIDARLAVFARVATALISDAQRDAALLAGDHTQAQIQAGIGAPAGVVVTLRRLPIEAIEQLVGRTFDGSPLATLLGTLAPEVAATVRQALLSGLAAGDGPRQIARTFAGAIDGGYQRAELIARTETLGAYRSAALANYQANSDVVDEWEWSADSKACDECKAKDGRRYPLTAPFDTHPNCIPAGAIVTAPPVEGSSARWFEGEVIDIETVNGYHLTVTPNHPILTSQGWVAAGLLDVGGDVLSCAQAERVAAIVNPDNYQVPSLIEHIAESVGRASCGTTYRVPTTAEDFHGDGTGSQISVIRANGFLRDRVNAQFSKPQSQQRFGGRTALMQGLDCTSPLGSVLNGLLSPAHSVLSGADVRCARCGGPLLHREPVRVGIGSQHNPSANQPEVYNISSDTQPMSDDVGGFAALIPRHNVFIGHAQFASLEDWGDFSASDGIGFSARSQQPAIDQSLLQSLFAGVEPCDDNFQAFASEIAIDRILDIRIRRFSGHVYNLQTIRGWYIANNIITHNCRCVPIPVTKSWSDLGILMSEDIDFDEAAWELRERAIWEVVSFDYTTQPRDAQGRWAPGEGSAEKKAMQESHRQARASLRAAHAQQRASLRSAHAEARASQPRGQRSSLNEQHNSERAALRATQKDERGQLSATHATERAGLTEGGSGRLGSVSQAYGTDPNSSYQMQHRLVDMSEIHASNTANGGINPDYDPRLQPRDRSRSASQAQIDEVARKMNPDVLVTDFHAIDRGTPIIDEHGNVLSGNGRTLTLQHASENYPENYAQYKERLKANARELGIDPAEVDRMSHPVLVRQLQGDVDTVAFAREANSSGTLRMSPLEQAKVDAGLLHDRSVLKINVDEGQSIDQALRAKSNRPFVDDFLNSVPENERAYLLTRDGELNQMGLYRAKAAVYTRVFQGEAGNRMAESMLESLDPELKNVQTGISQSLPQIARAKALIGSGQRAPDLDITEDSAKAIDTLARIKDNPSLTANTPAHLVVDKYLNQAQMFGRELTPNQEVLLKHFDSISRKPSEIKDFFSRYAQLVERAPAVGQTDLFGPTHAMTRGELIHALVSGGHNTVAQAQQQAGMFSAIRALFASVAGGLPPVRKRSSYADITSDDLVFSIFYDRIGGDSDSLTIGAPTTFSDEDVVMPPVTPDADPTQPVTRRGPIFRVGAYPDKQFSLTTDEAQRAVAAFRPVDIDSEHRASIFDGKLGQLRAVDLRGDVLYGEMAVPQWLHNLFPDEPIPVSTTWHREKKQIIKLALASNPRVTDAAMMAAFSDATFARHDTFEGQQAMQELHDHAARHGAVCNAPAKMHSAHEVSAMQKVHDTTIAHGATCNSIPNRMAAMSANKETSMDEERQSILQWLFGGGKKPTTEIAPAAFDVSGELLTARRIEIPRDQADEVARLKAELAKANAARITSDATHFADAQITAHKALPAEREAIIAAFTQAAQDDGQHGAVTFADGKTSSRVEQFKAMFAARPAHTLTTELITTQEGKEGVAFAGNKGEQPRTTDAEKPMTPERKKELLGLTAVGREVLKERTNGTR